MLVERRPRRSHAEQERFLYVTPAIDGLLSGSEPDVGFPDFRATAFVDRFMAGHLMGASLEGRSGNTVDIERLRDLDEVWALCIRSPRPGWRLFGRFMAKDCFVALLAFSRIELGSVGHYSKLAAQTVEAWNEMFSGREPHRGSGIDDYLGGVLTDVDASD